ncbi:MAG: hypothetical protein JWN95_660 [Frankiales bacterium]|nr:hypothetical protein [Frankiales bacterium]
MSGVCDALAREPIAKAARMEIAAVGVPWGQGADAVNAFLAQVIEGLCSHPMISVEHVEPDGGWPWSSFSEVLITDPDKAGGDPYLDGREIQGLSLCLCKLGPFAVLHSDAERSWNATGSARSLPDLYSVAAVPAAGWEALSVAAKDVLQSFGIRLLPYEVLEQGIDPDIEIETLIGDGNTVYDAWFHATD